MVRLCDARPTHLCALRDLCGDRVTSALALGARINEGDAPLYSSRSAAGEDELAAGIGEDGGTQQDGGGERGQSSIETESIDQFSDNDKTGQDANVTGAEDQGRARAAMLGG